MPRVAKAAPIAHFVPLQYTAAFLSATTALTEELMIKRFVLSAALAGCMFSAQAFATGLATCDSGPQEGWQPQAKLEQMLKDKGWQVRRIKVDGGCYEVYAMNEKGERVEAYFHPKTLESVPTKKQ